MTFTRINLALIGFMLMGYAFLDRTFAYFGFFPIYIGEIVLLVSILTALLTRIHSRYLTSPIALALLIFFLWQIVTLLFQTTGKWLDAGRDSVVWLYGLYAILIPSLLLRARAVEEAVSWYGWWMPWFLMWAAPAYVLMTIVGPSLPFLPGTDVTILHLKPGDMAVHLAGAGAFLALGLHREYPLNAIRWRINKELICWSGWILGVIAVGSRNRGGLVSIILALGLVTMFRPNNRLGRLVLPCAVLVSLLLIFDVSIPTGGNRELSPQQIFDNIASVVGKSKQENLTETVDWRLQWWEGILKDTVYGDSFWSGLGYGTDIAGRYGFNDWTGNRSPHNGHLTILARSGIPGIALWIVLILTTYITLTRTYLTAIHNGHTRAGKVNLWVMAYLTANLVNMSFDVYLEGPQGGIWYWSLIGFAIALTHAQRVNYRTMRRVAQPDFAAARYR